MQGSRDPTGALPVGVDLVYRWQFLLDNLPEWIGGGFSVGEFLLRSDGVLLRRSVTSSFSHGQTTWRAGQWSEFHRFTPVTGRPEAEAWLVALGYELGDPSPVPVDSDVAGPYPGIPPLFQAGGGRR